MERGGKPEAIYNEPGGDDDTKAAKADLDDVDSDPAAAATTSARLAMALSGQMGRPAAWNESASVNPRPRNG